MVVPFTPINGEKTSPKKRTAAEKDVPTTPKKKRSPTKVKSEDNEGEDAAEEPLSPHTPQTPRKRNKPSTPVTPGRPIPTSLELADEADRMLVKMKDDGVAWKEIREAWTRVTGETTGASTLP